MSGTELLDALDASRRQALAALGRGYRFRDEDPDDELFAAILTKMGLEDEVAVKWLLASWKVIRDEKGQAPGVAAPRAPQEAEPASDKQQAYLAKLADEKGFTSPHMAGMTKQRASELIDKLQSGSYDPERDDAPF